MLDGHSEHARPPFNNGEVAVAMAHQDAEQRERIALQEEELRIARQALGAAYAALCDDILGPNVSEEAVEQARAILSQALIDCYAVGS
jgi:hypothetical protein